MTQCCHARFAFPLIYLLLPCPYLNAQISSGTTYLHQPTIHADVVAFSAAGDLWTASSSGGAAKRLTSDHGTEGDPHFSPDGRWIAFTGRRDGSPEAYVIPASGGESRRLTYDPYGVAVTGWSSDGREVLFKSARENDEPTFRLYSVSVRGGAPQLLPLPPISAAAANQNGREIAYVAPSYNRLWFGYRGGQAGDVWIADTSARTFRNVTSSRFVETSPAWANGDLFFSSEAQGMANLFRLSRSTGQAVAITRYTDHPVRAITSDGHRLVYEHGTSIEIFDPRAGQVSRPSFTFPGLVVPDERVVNGANLLREIHLSPANDRLVVAARGQLALVPLHGRASVLEATVAARAETPAWSPDGKAIAFVSDRSSDEEIWLQSADGSGVARQLTRNGSGPLASLVWSPDGRWIAAGDHELRVLLVDAQSGATRVVDQGTNPETGSYSSVNDSYRFSPDGRWLAYAKLESNDRHSVYLYHIDQKTRTRVTPREVNSFSPVFDPAGRYLFFLADREYFGRRDLLTLVPQYTRPKTRVSFVTLREYETDPTMRSGPQSSPALTRVANEVRIDTANIQRRIVDVPLPTADYDRIDATMNHVLFTSGGSLMGYRLGAVSPSVLGPAGPYEVARDGRHVLLTTGVTSRVFDAEAATPDSGAQLRLDSLTLRIKTRAEWQQILLDAGRAMHRYFYDPAMRGLEWPQIVRKYEEQLPAVTNREDLNLVISDLMSELRTSHAKVEGGDLGVSPTSVPIGSLGVDFVEVPNANGPRIRRLLEGDPFDPRLRSPLLSPGLGVHAGDFIVAVDGVSLHEGADINAYLLGKADSLVRLTVSGTADGTNARDVSVRLLADESRLRVAAGAAKRRDFVEKATGGRLTYVHLPTMGPEALEQYGKRYFANRDRAGIIFDVRNNGGGSVGESILLQLANPPEIFHKPRYGKSWTRQGWGFAGALAVMCDGSSGSNAEEFCYGFKHYRLGPVIGSRTEGGVIGGCCGHPLVDGGVLMIPNYLGWVVKNGNALRIIEGDGVLPDVDIAFDPVAYLGGRDVVLEAAVHRMLSQLESRSPKRSAPPPPSRQQSQREAPVALRNRMERTSRSMHVRSVFVSNVLHQAKRLIDPLNR